MTTDQPKVTTYFVCISAIGFLLHLIWEYVQCSTLFVHLKIPPSFWSMLCASLGDIGILWTAYLIVAAANRNFYWARSCQNLVMLTIFAGISAGFAIIIEYFAIGRGLWTYTLHNPKVGGISVVPPLQMVTMNPLTIFLSNRILNKRKLAK